MDILTGLQTVNAGERQQMMEPHHRVVGNGQSPKKTLENIASAYQGGKKKPFKRPKPRI